MSKDKFKSCRDGNHKLVKIISIPTGEDECKVVRWCKDCGSIVIDHDIDGRTHPGYYHEMINPKIWKKERAKTNADKKDSV